MQPMDESKHSKSAPAPEPYAGAKSPVHELWSTISQGDLGLKAGFWTGEDFDPLTFKPIVGWITVMMRQPPFADDRPPKNGFYAVVLADSMLPTVADFLPNFRGVFLKEMSEDQAKSRAKEWMNRPEPDLQPTMGLGHA
jgi:hypothetical protein